MPNPRPFINRAVVQRGVREERARRMRELGRTRWGQAWLGALHAVDHESRLGRGLAYARQGAVEEIRLGRAGEIAARVRGSGRRAYRVDLSLRPFAPAQVEALVAEVARRPDWLDLLLSGRLPAGLERLDGRSVAQSAAAGGSATKQRRLELFPRSWRDVGMRCDCPDEAVPCKHIAAALYRLAQYIDDDPLLLFQLRGLDLPTRLGELAGGTDLSPVSLRVLQEAPTDAHTAGTLPTGDEFRMPPAEANAAAEALQDSAALGRAQAEREHAADEPLLGEADNLLAELEAEDAEDVAASLDPGARAEYGHRFDEALRAVPRLLELWPRILPARPPFVEGADLAQLYATYLRVASAFWREGLRGDGFGEALEDDPAAAPRPLVPDFAAPGVPAWRVADFRVVLDAGGGFAEAHLLGHDGAVVHVFDKEVALLAYAEREGRALPLLSAAYRLARRLTVGGAVVPRLLHLAGDTYRARWQPAVQDAAVAEAVRCLGDAAELQRRLVYRVADEGPGLFDAQDVPPAHESEAAYRARLGREVAAAVDAGLDTDAEAAAPQLHELHPVRHDAAAALLAVFLKPMLLAGVEAVFAKADDPAVRLLFLGRPVELIGPAEAQLALAVQLWLRRLSLDDAEQRLAIQIEEDEGRPGGYALKLLLMRERGGAPEPVPAAEVLRGERGEVLRLQVLRDAALLAEAYEPFGAYVAADARPPDALRLYGGDFAGFLFEVVPALRLVGAELLLPPGLERAARPQLTAEVREVDGEPADKTGEGTDGDAEAEEERKRPPGLLGLSSLVEFDWQVSVGGEERLTADEFAELAARYEGIVRLRDGYVWLEPGHTERLLRRLAEPPEPAPQVVVQSLLTGDFRDAPLFLTESVRRLRDELLAAPAQGPDEARLEGLQATLRPYQEVGFAWLLRNAEAGLGSLLADDMGLGKTLQTIALLEHYRALGRWRDRPALVVVPTSLITNWQRELERFAPELNVGVYHGPGRALRHLEGAEVVLTSYGIVRSEGERLHRVAWGALVIDEAQQIKNPGAAQTQAVKALDAPLRIALSGTPVENRLAEYWSVLDFANPGYLGPLEQFRALYADPIERDRDPERLEAFRQVTAPFLLRRLKTDKSVIRDLPEKITQVEFCQLATEQAALYQQVVETQVRELAAAEPHERRGRILKFMTAVKQVCNHPRHYLKRGTRAPEASGKSARLLELLEAALGADERVLIFTQYRQMGELLQEMLAERLGYTPPFLHGGLEREERDAMVAALQDGSGPPILLLSIKAGGTGLNLTAANHVIHYDLWWNPAVESQATDRAFRIGQRRNVHVHRLVCAGTFEERIDQMLAAKRELADLTVGEGGAWIGDIAEEIAAEAERMAGLG